MPVNRLPRLYPGDPLPTATMWNDLVSQVEVLTDAVRKVSGGAFTYIGPAGAVIAARRIPPQSVAGGGGISIKTVKIITVSPLVFNCRDVNYTDGTEIPGTPFQVFPRVVDNGYITAGYNLTAVTGTVVVEKFVTGNYLDVFSSELKLYRGTVNPPARWWTLDMFHLSSCTA